MTEVRRKPHSGHTTVHKAWRRTNAPRQHLIADIEAGRVNIVVVYKIDRLTRSLTDFVKMVEVFERHGVSFVSVTQQFNTTTSMGRLMLNILLSFAQFEREVTGERIRDKIAASKRKGMWMGGVPPLGYDVEHRRLVPNEREAKLVRHIFQRFVELGSSTLLVKELKLDSVTSKSWRRRMARSAKANPSTRASSTSCSGTAPTWAGCATTHRVIRASTRPSSVASCGPTCRCASPATHACAATPPRRGCRIFSRASCLPRRPRPVPLAYHREERPPVPVLPPAARCQGACGRFRIAAPAGGRTGVGRARKAAIDPALARFTG